MLIELLKQAGYSAELRPKSRYMKGLVPLLGGQYTLDMLQNEDIIRLFSNAQIRKGRAYNLKQLIQIANPNQQTPRFIEQIAILAASTAFIRGYRLQCPTCDLDTWYAIHDIAEQVTCEGCRIPFQLPLELDFAFRPNRLLMEALKSGALSVLLTLNYWLQDSPVIVWQSNISVSHHGRDTDIDLLVQREDGLYMAECKDKVNLENDQAIQTLREQLAVGKQIASDIGANYSFTTLNEDTLPSALQDFLKQEDITLLDRQQLLA
jgi:hypothetical protein